MRRIKATIWIGRKRRLSIGDGPSSVMDAAGVIFHASAPAPA
jgi:hypothetical protein